MTETGTVETTDPTTDQRPTKEHSVPASTPMTPGHTQFRAVPVDLIFPDPDQPRREIAVEKVRELADSIRVVGVKEPVILRPRPGDRLGGYFLVAGETRWLAVKQIAAERGEPDTRIPAIVRLDLFDGDEAFEAAAISNLSRNDMDDLDAAAALRRIYHWRKCGSDAQLARIVGRSQAWVSSTLVLNELPEQYHEPLRRGEITRGDAVRLAREAAGRTGTQHRPDAKTRTLKRPPQVPVKPTRGFSSGTRPWHEGRAPRVTPPPAPTPAPILEPAPAVNGHGHANGRPKPPALASPFTLPASGHTVLADSPTAPSVAGDALRELLRAAYRAGVASWDTTGPELDEDTVLDALMQRAAL